MGHVAPPTIWCHCDIITSSSASSCMACARLKNASGQTAYDVAVMSGSNDMVSLLAAQTGLDLLGKLGKLNRTHRRSKPADLSGPSQWNTRPPAACEHFYFKRCFCKKMLSRIKFIFGWSSWYFIVLLLLMRSLLSLLLRYQVLSEGAIVWWCRLKPNDLHHHLVNCSRNQTKFTGLSWTRNHEELKDEICCSTCQFHRNQDIF